MNQVTISQEEYDALTTLEPNTMYFIEDSRSQTLAYDSSNSWFTNESIEDTFNNMLEQYKQSIKLRPNSCINCGGGIDSETMLCKFCGTSYRI